MAQLWVIIGGIAGFLGVAGGAFGAHALKTHLTPERLEVFQTGTHYAQIHAVALLVVGLLSARSSASALTAAGGGFTAGILLFTGSLWLLAITGKTWMGAITPLGGVAFLIGWASLVVAAARGSL